jgi:oxygen-independent coproporphyrinogen-3 oxidase
VGYAYAYPHKTAYRPLDPPVSLTELWSAERRHALFLYLHVPFCEMRCGFCNLFTQTKPKGDFAEPYLHALLRQARQVRAALKDARFARLAVGGGTPTYLDVSGLETILDIAEEIMGADLALIPVSIETSPGTAEADKLALLRERGVKRISIGVQTFIEAEATAVARPQKTVDVEVALERLRAAGFPTLNIDLIYGLPGQTVTSWLTSIRAALRYAPEEFYLYPLYVRPLTGLGRSQREWDDLRLACYREARSLLRDEGYSQISMRLFRAAHRPEEEGPVYCCQADGMVGLGCGARSYTQALHYSSEYAVRSQGIRAILTDYVSRPAEAFGRADYGYQLNAEEQRRRYVIQSLLQQEGLSYPAYQRRFGTDARDDFPQLAELDRQV